MSSETDPIARIQELVLARYYRIGLHAVRHMVEEGFDENQLLETIRGKLRIVEEYPEESRYLMLGYFHFTPKTTSPLHLLCDLSKPNVVDIVTAYIPQRPWWVSPTRRGREKR
jgi:hypothetical protein